MNIINGSIYYLTHFDNGILDPFWLYVCHKQCIAPDTRLGVEHEIEAAVRDEVHYKIRGTILSEVFPGYE